MTKDQAVFDAQKQIFAGKLRRYHGESWLTRLLDVKTNLLNIRDIVFTMMGMVESVILLIRVKPDVVLLKGGFVGMPVGLAAALLRTPFITHDSDAVPGLANRVVARWARYHATGMPASFYNYQQDSVRYVGVLVSDKYQPVTSSQQRDYRKELNIPEDAKVLMITGGSNGAEIINKAIRKVLPKLKSSIPKLYVIHQTGRHKEYQLQESTDWLIVEPLLTDMHRYSGAADVIVTRAGANTMAEFGVQGRACIVVPNPLLTGGHQMVNARELSKHDAVLVVNENELDTKLPTSIQELLHDADQREKFGAKLSKLTKTNAADELADLLLTIVEESN